MRGWRIDDNDENEIEASEDQRRIERRRRGEERSERSSSKFVPDSSACKFKAPRSDTDTCKVIECANTVIIAAYRCSCFLIVGDETRLT